MQQPPTLKTENYLRDVLFIFFAQRNLILGTTALIFSAAVLIATFWPRTFGAYGTVLLRAKDLQKSPQALERIDVRTFPIEKEDLFAEMEMLRSPDVIKAALKKLNDAGDPDGKVDPGWLREKITTQIQPASHFINISMEGKNPAVMVKWLDMIMLEYIVHRTEIHFPTGAVKFYADQANLFKAQMNDIEKELIALVETTNNPDPNAAIATNLLFKRNTEQELFMIRNRLISEEEEVSHLAALLESKEPNHFNFLANPTLNQISQRLVDLKYERDKALRLYTPESKNVTRVTEQLDKTQLMLNREVQFYCDRIASKVEATREKSAAMAEILVRIDSDNVALKRQSLRQAELTEESRLLRDSYQTFVKRREEARMNSSVDAGYSSFFVSILNRGFSSPSALFPRPKVLIPLGLIAGLITGFALGFLREYFDHTFKNPRDVEHFAGLPLLFSIPVLPEPKAPLAASQARGSDTDDPL